MIATSTFRGSGVSGRFGRGTWSHQYGVGRKSCANRLLMGDLVLRFSTFASYRGTLLCERRNQRDIIVVDPDRVDHRHALIEVTEIVHVPDQRLAPFVLPEDALGLGLQHM